MKPHLIGTEINFLRGVKVGFPNTKSMPMNKLGNTPALG